MFGLIVSGRVSCCLLSSSPSLDQNCKDTEDFLWGKLWKQCAHTIWVKGTRVKCLKKIQAVWGEKLFLENFTNGFAMFEEKKEKLFSLFTVFSEWWWPWCPLQQWKVRKRKWTWNKFTGSLELSMSIPFLNSSSTQT